MKQMRPDMSIEEALRHLRNEQNPTREHSFFRWIIPVSIIC